MSRPLALGGTAVALLALIAGTVALWFLTGTGAPPPTAPADGAETAGTGGVPLAGGGPPGVAGSAAASGRADGPSAPGTGAPPAVPWIAGPMEMRAPTPDEIPCGDLNCLSEDPERYRVEVHGMLAREGLELLLEDAGIEGEQAAELRSQLEANLDAFARGPGTQGE